MSSTTAAPPDRPVYVTQPSLPPLDEFMPHLQAIWESRQLTNGGPYVQRLEQALSEHLGIAHLSLFASGTTALLVALQSLDLVGEVITTPYSFVATTHALHWCGLQPVFVDVDPATFNLDPKAIEAAITPRTSAILPVHCYGRPCDVEAIGAIARRHGLRVLYDAAHAFGVSERGGSVLRHGDLSVLSFHATKVFSTFEGGAIVCPDAATKRRIDVLRNFGISGELTVEAPGINGKLNEVSAAFGLVQLAHVDGYIARNRALDARYRAGLAAVDGIRCAPAYEGANCAYFPIMVEPGYPLSRDELYRKLHGHGVHARRYFHPLLCDLPTPLSPAESHDLPHARALADGIICLPIYPDLDPAIVDHIVELVTQP